MSDEKQLDNPGDDIKIKRNIVLESIGEDMIAEQKRAEDKRAKEALKEISIKNKTTKEKKYLSEDALARIARDEGVGAKENNAVIVKEDELDVAGLEDKTRVFENKKIEEPLVALAVKETKINEGWQDEVENAARDIKQESRVNNIKSNVIVIADKVAVPLEKKRVYKKRKKTISGGSASETALRKKSHRKIVAERKLANRSKPVSFEATDQAMPKTKSKNKMTIIVFIALLILVLAVVSFFLLTA